jgi:NADPH:quinone reductase-like Zn-dependent oxidoreductase
VGDEIFASVFDLERGTLAEFAAVPESAAALKPANLDFVQAASTPMVGLTAWQALKHRAGLRAGQKVFIPAGAGGIGTMAIQLAKQWGARVGTTTSTGNVALVRSLGADEVIDSLTTSANGVVGRPMSWLSWWLSASTRPDCWQGPSDQTEHERVFSLEGFPMA